MLIAYVDESGDTGDPAQSGSSACYALGCVLVDVADWPNGFDFILGHRRRLRDTFGVLLRDELKAQSLIRGSGDLARHGLSPGARQRIYQSSLRAVHHTPGRAFAIVTDKARSGYVGQACFDETWTMLLQRLERTSTYEARTPMMIVHDEGENDQIRKLVRKARRHLTAGSRFGTGTILTRLDHLIEDPSPRQSHHSFFIQMADLVAYAGWRSYMPPGAGAARVCPPTMWGNLGGAIHAPVNKYSKRPGDADGVVIRR